MTDALVERIAKVIYEDIDEPMWGCVVIAKEIVAALGLREERMYLLDPHPNPEQTVSLHRNADD